MLRSSKQIFPFVDKSYFWSMEHLRKAKYQFYKTKFHISETVKFILFYIFLAINSTRLHVDRIPIKQTARWHHVTWDDSRFYNKAINHFSKITEPAKQFSSARLQNRKLRQFFNPSSPLHTYSRIVTVASSFN